MVNHFKNRLMIKKKKMGKCLILTSLKYKLHPIICYLNLPLMLKINAFYHLIFVHIEYR